MPLEHAIKSGEVFFFAGAGVSFPSGLAFPSDVIEGTCAKFFPEFRNMKDKNGKSRLEIVRDIQPELFYSILWDCVRDDHCLDMWNCLKKDGPDYSPKPNINHRLLVLYSYKNRLPIFTVNFDSMFEQAASALHIPYLVLTHNDEPPTDSDILYICKLHGDIKSEITINSICTTIDSISRRNQKWLKYIDGLKWEKKICFIGYSGRDIDYFPRFCETFKHKSYWIPVVDDDEITKVNAKKIDARIIKDYPDQYFILHFSSDPGFEEAFNKIEPSVISGKNEFFANISSNMSDISFNHDVFWIHLMGSIGYVHEARKCIDRIDGVPSGLSEVERYIFLCERAKVYREQANFPKYRKTHKKILREVKEDRQKLLSEFEIISSYQMTIPQEPRMPVWAYPLRRPFLFLYVARKFACFLQKHKTDYIGNEGVMQEALIRNLAIYIGIADSDFMPKFLKNISFRYYQKHCPSILDFVDGERKKSTTQETYWSELRSILEAAEVIGNISGINSCTKYMRRPFFAEQAKRDGRPDNNVTDTIFSITHDISAKSNDIAHSGGDIFEAIDQAKKNDNVLNIVKFILESNRQKAIGWERNRDMFFEYASKIRPKILMRTYKLLGEYYLKNFKN